MTIGKTGYWRITVPGITGLDYYIIKQVGSNTGADHIKSSFRVFCMKHLSSKRLITAGRGA